MLNRIKNAFDTEEEERAIQEALEKEEEMNIKIEKARNKIKGFQRVKERLEREISPIKERNEQLEVLLPFEKMELLNKEIELLEVKKEILYNQIIIKREEREDNASPVLDEAWVKTRDKIKEKIQKRNELFSEAMKLENKYKVEYALHHDPRISTGRRLTTAEMDKRNEVLGELRIKLIENKKLMEDIV